MIFHKNRIANGMIATCIGKSTKPQYHEKIVNMRIEHEYARG
jgi:hypothetical protein